MRGPGLLCQATLSLGPPLGGKDFVYAGFHRAAVVLSLEVPGPPFILWSLSLPLPAALPVTLLAFLLVSPQMSDRLRRSWPPSFLSEFRALQFSLMLCAFVGALGGAAFLGTAIFIEGDRRQAQLHVQGQSGPPAPCPGSWFCLLVRSSVSPSMA